MKRILFVLILTLIVTVSDTMAQDYIYAKKTDIKSFKAIDKVLEERLNLTDEQIKYLKSNRQKKLKEMEKIISKMETTHKKIRNIYMLGIPKYQADIKSSPYKMELVLLKQNADLIRAQNRKNFEAILTPEQKTELKKVRQEMLLK